MAWTGLGWPGLAWAGLDWPELARNSIKIIKNIKNCSKQVQVAPFGLILGENVATGSGKPLECLPGPKGSRRGPGVPGPPPYIPYRGPVWLTPDQPRWRCVCYESQARVMEDLLVMEVLLNI